jgi:DNA-binding response OmpR family regulator
MREFLCQLLADEWDVDEACDGLHALNVASRRPPDLVLADVVMPGLDGVGLVRALRAHPRTASTPIILMTGSSNDDSRAASAEAGANDYLLKPLTMREIRSRVRGQLELARARAEATEVAQRSKNDFLALVGHELRNPLSTISTMLQALMMRGPSPEVELMGRGVRQLTRLVEDLLESSQLSRGTVELQKRPIELSQVVDRAMELVSPWFDDKKNKVTVCVPRVGWRIEADPERLARAISNILMNATEHSPAGMPITVDAQRLGDRIALRIVDKGAGIAPERLPVLFATFQDHRRDGGLGLGLAIARSIVELHHGSISVKSDGHGRGTECSIDLPATSAAAADAPPAMSQPRKRLLLVEDNDDAARALKAALEQLGYEVALAHDAPIAINLARTFQPDVALLDLGLPVMDGWELAKRLRSASTELPIVAVTARDQESDKQRSAELGFAEHLVKPIDLGKLERIVQQLAVEAARTAPH